MLRKRVPVSHLFNRFFCYITVPSFEMLKLALKDKKTRLAVIRHPQWNPLKQTQNSGGAQGPSAGQPGPCAGHPYGIRRSWSHSRWCVFPEDRAQRPCQMKAFSSIKKLVGQLGSFCSLPFHITTVHESKYNIHQLCFWWMFLNLPHSKLM